MKTNCGEHHYYRKDGKIMVMQVRYCINLAPRFSNVRAGQCTGTTNRYRFDYQEQAGRNRHQTSVALDAFQPFQ